jgi:translation initiation factor 5A
MADDGETKDDVKVPEGEVGEKIDKLFTTEEKDTSELPLCQTWAKGFANPYPSF